MYHIKRSVCKQQFVTFSYQPIKPESWNKSKFRFHWLYVRRAHSGDCFPSIWCLFVQAGCNIECGWFLYGVYLGSGRKLWWHKLKCNNSNKPDVNKIESGASERLQRFGLRFSFQGCLESRWTWFLICLAITNGKKDWVQLSSIFSVDKRS